MMRRCLDEGLLQAYVDGELSQEQTREAAAHVAACESCAAALAAAEGESAFFATAFAPDDSVRVPTEVLRSRISAAVARLESENGASRARTPGRSFGGFLATLSGLFTFTPQGAAAFASLLAVVALALIFFMAQRSQASDKGRGAKQVASNPTNALPPAVKEPTTKETPRTTEPPVVAPAVVPPETVSDGGKRVLANYSPRRPANRSKTTGGGPAAPSAVKEQMLPGEKQYQTAIASLEKTIKLGGDATLKPAVRVKYERDLALIDSAITETRRVAAENPKDKDVVGFLMSAYQSKVELLTQVADQAQVAALGR